MVDTARTLAALQTLLADNTSGDISEQDIRDMLLSLFVQTTVGDLPGIASGGVMERLAVGADGKVLVAASGETVGMKWDTRPFLFYVPLGSAENGSAVTP